MSGIEAHPESEADLTAALAALLGRERGAAVRVAELRRLSGGASRETWSFTADGEPLILQRNRGQALEGPSMAAEDALLVAAERAGVPVPPVVVDAAATRTLVGDGRITGHVPGEGLGPRIIRDDRYAEARAVLAGQCGRALAAIHSIDPAVAPDLQAADPIEALRAGLDLAGEARPTFELALRGLADRRPEPASRPSVVHGDFRLGNLLVDETGLRAVLDWELAHLGDPLEDLGWLCVRSWRFGGPGEVAGVAPLDDLLDAYGDATGTRPDPEAVRWWIAAGTLRWGLICAVQAHRHLDGQVRSVELATIGRRIAETEYDLLDLLGVPAADPSPSTESPRGEHDRHGRPTAAELIEAVRTHLADVVAPQMEGAAAFQLRVAGNALAIVERELQLAPAAPDVDEAALAASIRAGDPDLDLSPTGPLAAAIRARVVDRVRVANPKWLLGPDRDA